MKILPVMRTDEHHIEKHRKFLEWKDKQDIRLLFIGDSLVRRWEDNIELWNGFFSEYGAANFGVGADCLENILWRIQNGELDGMDPQAAVILAGTNNLEKNTADEITDAIREIVDIFRNRLPNTKIVVLGLLPRDNDETGTDYAGKIGRINRRLQSLYDGSDVHFRDIGGRLTDEHGAVRRDIMPDGLHLNADGYRFVGPMLQEIIEDVWHA
jgi:platelet-activating factor acetylhydrolase IB subunit beta/gamma